MDSHPLCHPPSLLPGACEDTHTIREAEAIAGMAEDSWDLLRPDLARGATTLTPQAKRGRGGALCAL